MKERIKRALSIFCAVALCISSGFGIFSVKGETQAEKSTAVLEELTETAANSDVATKKLTVNSNNLTAKVKSSPTEPSEKVTASSATPTAVYTTSTTSTAAENLILNAVEGSDKLIKNAVKSLSGKSIYNEIESLLFDDNTLSSLFLGLYSSLSESEESLKSLGIDVSKDNLSRLMGGYPSVQKALDNAESLEKLSMKNVKWNVNSKQELLACICAIVSPFNNVLSTVFGGRDYNSGIIKIKGNYGYEKGLLPMLRALGAVYLPEAESFNALAKESAYNISREIAASLLSTLENISLAPVSTVCRLLPDIAYFINEGGLQNATDELMKPFTLSIGGYRGLFKGSQMVSLFLFLQNPKMYTMNFKTNTANVINDMIQQSGFSVKEIDLKAIESLQGNMGGTFEYIFKWIAAFLKNNKEKLFSGTQISLDGIDSSKLFDALFAVSEDKLFDLYVSLFSEKEGASADFEPLFTEYKKEEIQYTENLTRENFQRVVKLIDGTVNDFAVEFTENGSLEDTLKAVVYSPDTLTMLVKTLYGLSDKDGLKEIFGLFDIPSAPKKLSAYISNPVVKAELAKANRWSKITVLSWSFPKGDRSSFQKYLAETLSPLQNVLEFFLCEGELKIFDSIILGGTNGYNFFVIPLLEALGVNQKSIKSYKAYKKGAATDKIITDILNPVFDLADKIIKKPVRTLVNISPNILYYLDSGKLLDSAEKLLYPVTNMLEQVSLSLSDLGADTEKIKSTDLLDYIGSLLEKADFGIKLTKPDLKKIMCLGEKTEYKSKAVSGGKGVTAVYIKSDAPAVMLTSLRYIFTELQSEDNKGYINGLMSSDGSDDGMFSQYSSGIGDKMADMSADETIEWLYRLFFHERAVEETTESYIPTIYYENKKSKSTALIPVILASAIILSVGAAVIIKRKRDEKNADT